MAKSDRRGLEAAAKKIGSLLRDNREALVRTWRSRIESEPAIFGGLAASPEDEMLHALLVEFREALCDGGFSTGAPALAAEMQTISGQGDPRQDAAIWIEIISLGRAVVEAFLTDVAMPGLGLSDGRQEEVLDELERAFHMVTHRRIQVLCDFCLRPGLAAR